MEASIGEKLTALSFILADMISYYQLDRTPSATMLAKYASQLLESRKTWSLADFALWSKNITQGRYQNEVKLFGKIDMETINAWCACYEMERAEKMTEKHREIAKEQEKQTESNLAELTKQGFEAPKTVGYKRKTVMDKLFSNNPEAFHNYALGQLCKEDVSPTSFSDKKTNYIFLHFERIGAINILVEEKKKMFDEMIAQGLKQEEAVVACRRIALKKLIAALENTKEQDVIQKKFDNMLTQMFT